MWTAMRRRPLRETPGRVNPGRPGLRLCAEVCTVQGLNSGQDVCQFYYKRPYASERLTLFRSPLQPAIPVTISRRPATSLRGVGSENSRQGRRVQDRIEPDVDLRGQYPILSRALPEYRHCPTDTNIRSPRWFRCTRSLRLGSRYCARIFLTSWRVSWLQ